MTDREQFREVKIDEGMLRDAPTDYLIDVAAARDSQARLIGAELDMVKAELQRRAESTLSDRHIKFTELYGDTGSYVNVSYAQKLDVLNMPMVRELLPEVAAEKILVKPAEVKYDFEKVFKTALIAVITGDYDSEYTVEEIIDKAGWRMDGKQRALILKKLKGDYAKDRDMIRRTLGNMTLDVDVELYLIAKARNWQLIQAFFPVADFAAWAAELKKYVVVDETPKIELKYS